MPFDSRFKPKFDLPAVQQLSQQLSEVPLEIQEHRDLVREKTAEMLEAHAMSKEQIVLSALGMTREQAMQQRARMSYHVDFDTRVETLLLDGEPLLEIYPIQFETVGTVIHSRVPYRLLRQP